MGAPSQTPSAWAPIWPAWAATVRVLGADGGGLGFDGYGLSLDFEGADSILGAEGGSAVPGLGYLGVSEDLGPIGALGEGASAGVGQAASLGTLSVPPSWADAVSSVTPLPPHSTPTSCRAAGARHRRRQRRRPAISKLPLGGMVGRESDGAVQRIGFRSSLIPRSPVAG